MLEGNIILLSLSRVPHPSINSIQRSRVRNLDIQASTSVDRLEMSKTWGGGGGSFHVFFFYSCIRASFAENFNRSITLRNMTTRAEHLGVGVVRSSPRVLSIFVCSWLGRVRVGTVRASPAIRSPSDCSASYKARSTF